MSYETDLAYIHDVGYGEFARRMAPGVLRLLDDAGLRDGTVVDFGCGSGIWADQLVRAGYRVVGADYTAAMIQLARRRVPAGRFHVESFVTFSIPPCSAVTALGEALAYRLDAGNSRSVLTKVSRRVYRALNPGGLFIFDLPDVDLEKRRPRTFAAGDDWAVMVEFTNDPVRQQLTRRITSFRQMRECYRRREEIHRLHLYRPKDVALCLRQVGFRVRIRRTIGDYPLPRNHFAVVAKKPDDGG